MQAVLRHLRLQARPVPEVRRGDAPEIILKLALRRRAALVRLVGTLPLRHLATRFDRSVVDRLEDLKVQLACLHRIERQAEGHERIGETLHTNADRAVTHVRVARLNDGVVVGVDDAVKVERDHLGDVVEPLEVVLASLDKGRKSNGSQVANSRLVWSGVFDDLRAEVRGLDGTKVLLVRFPCDDC